MKGDDENDENIKIFESSLVRQALKESVVKLNPKYMMKNPMHACRSGHVAIILLILYLIYLYKNMYRVCMC